METLIEMIEKLTNWLKGLFPGENPVPPRAGHKKSFYQGPKPRAAKRDVPELTPDFNDADADIQNTVESLGPGKNVLVRKFVREETGTHETLKILDDSVLDTGEEEGLDPYNTGSFDRSKKWDQRFRK